MAKRKFTLTLDEGLFHRARRELPPEVSWSALLGDSLRRQLAEQDGCQHSVLRCASCGVEVAGAEPAAVVDGPGSVDGGEGGSASGAGGDLDAEPAG